jgi:hypothetical protein
MGSCQQSPIGIKPQPLKSGINNNQNFQKPNESIIQTARESLKERLNPNVQIFITKKSESNQCISQLQLGDQNQNVWIDQEKSVNSISIPHPPIELKSGRVINQNKVYQYCSSRLSEIDRDSNQALNPKSSRESAILVPFIVTRNSNSVLKSPNIDGLDDQRKKVFHERHQSVSGMKTSSRENMLQVYQKESFGNSISPIQRSLHQNGFLTDRPKSVRRSVTATGVALYPHHKNLLSLIEHGQVTTPAKQIIGSSMMNSGHQKDISSIQKTQKHTDIIREVLSSKRVRLLHLEDSGTAKSNQSPNGSPSRFVKNMPMSVKLEHSIVDAEFESLGKKISLKSIGSAGSHDEKRLVISDMAAPRFRIASAQQSKRALIIHPQDDELRSSRYSIKKLEPGDLTHDIRKLGIKSKDQFKQEIDFGGSARVKPTRKLHTVNPNMKLVHATSLLKEPLPGSKQTLAKEINKSKSTVVEFKKWESMMMPSEMVKHKNTLNLLNKLTLMEPKQSEIVENEEPAQSLIRNSTNDSIQHKHLDRASTDHELISTSQEKMDSVNSHSHFFKKQRAAHKKIITLEPQPKNRKKMSADSPNELTTRRSSAEGRGSEEHPRHSSAIHNPRKDHIMHMHASKRQTLEPKHSTQSGTSKFARDTPITQLKDELPVLNEGNSEPCSPVTENPILQ